MMLAALLLTLGMPLLSSCSSDDDDNVAVVEPTATGTFTDERDGETYGYVRYGDLEWTTENCRYDTGEGCNVYIDNGQSDDDSLKHLAKYGRLYTHSAAEKAVPEGWRLPTDADWTALEQITGNYMTTALNLRYGGYYTQNTVMGGSGWRFRGVYGFYWAATQDDSKDGEYYFYRKIVYNELGAQRQSQEAANQLSVRFVRDAK